MPEVGCTKNHDYPPHEEARAKQVSDGEVDQIVDRLYNTKTMSFEGTAGEQAKAEDIIRY